MIKRSLTGLLVVTILFGLSGIAQAAKLKATLANVKGDVQVQAAPDADFKAAADGAALGEGATIKTGADGEAILKWGVGNVVSVFPLTKLSVEALVAEDNGDTDSKLSLTGGRAMSQVGKLATPKSAFSIKTPTAVAGVRGTAFDAEVPPGGGSVSIACVEGAIVLTVGDVEVVINEGFELSVAEGEVPVTPSAIPPARLENLRSAINVLKQISKEADKQEKKEEKKAEKEEKKEEQKEEKKEEGGAGEDASASATETALENAVSQTTINDSISDIAADAAAGCPAGGGCIEGTLEF